MTFYKERDEANVMLLLKEIDDLGPDYILKHLGAKDNSLIQKKIYIASQFGIDLGFCFDFYISGPFSTELKCVLNRVKAEKTPLNYYTKFYKLKTITVERIENIKYLFTVPEKLDIDMDRWLLLVSIVLYLYDVGRDLTFVFDNINKKNTVSVDEINVVLNEICKVKHLESSF